MSSMTGYSGPAGGGKNNAAGLSGGNKIPKGYEFSQIQNYTPEQMQLFKQSFGHLGPNSYLSRLAGGDEGIFNEIEAPAHRQFQGLQGDLASRFSGAGMGARRGSGFQNTLNQETSDFAMNLQAQRQGLQQQAIKDLMGLSNNLLNQRPYETGLAEKPKKWWQSALIGGATGFGQGAGQALGAAAFA